MEQLSRTVSAESTKSWKASQLLASSVASTSPVSSRKARSSEPDTTSGNVERASISMPPPATKVMAMQLPSRRPSKASESMAVDELDATPTLEASRGGSPIPPQTLALPDTAYRQPAKTDGDAESNRMSFSSLYSLGSAIHSTGARGLSGPSSVAGSEPEGTPFTSPCYRIFTVVDTW